MEILGVLFFALFMFLLVRSILSMGRLSSAEMKIKQLEARLKKLEQAGPVKIVERVVEVAPNVQEVPKEIIVVSPPPPVAAKQEEKVETPPPIVEEVVIPIEEIVVTPVGEEPKPEEIPAGQSGPVEEPVYEPDLSGYMFSRNAQNNPIPVAKKPESIKEKRSDFWTNVEKQFVENWTGILGAVIMVAGVVFFGIYAALKVSALYRFFLIVGFSVLLTAGFIYLKRHDKWVKLALWLRSSAGAVFLFGCLGSAGIPGLQWVFDPLIGILVLSGGIVVNLFLGYIGGNQIYASLHVLLSLVALSIVPPNSITLVLAALVSLFGIALTYREKWNCHLLLTISSFFAYHLYWFYQQPVITFQYKILGIITVIAISISVALVHYRSVYKSKTFDALPFIVHLINWFYFGIGLYLYSSHMRISTLFLSLGAIAAFFLARRARKYEITWLYYTDTLVAQATAIIALLSLLNWQMNLPFIITTVFAEVLLYLVIMMKEKQDFLYKVGLVMTSTVGLILLLVSGVYMTQHMGVNNLYEQAAELFFCFFAGTVFAIYAAAKNKEIPESFILYGIMLAGLFVLGNVMLFITDTQLSTIYLAAGSVITFLLGARLKKAELHWLYFMDTLLSQLMAVVALITLRNWDFDNLFILSSIYAVVILFILSSIRQKNEILYQIWGGGLYLVSIAIVFTSVFQIDYLNTTILYTHAAEVGSCFVLGLLFLFFGNTKGRGFGSIFDIFGLLIGAFFAVIYLHLYHVSWIGCGSVTVALVILFLKEKSQLIEITLAAIAVLFSVYFINWYYLINTYTEVNGVRIFLEGIPLFVLSAFAIKWSGYFGKFQNWAGIYLFALHTVILSYLIFDPISEFIPGVLWLALSPVALELSHFARKRMQNAEPYKNQTARFLLHIGYIFILLFLFRHVFNDSYSVEYLGAVIKTRFLIEIFALLVFAYWAKAKKPEGAIYKSWEYLHPLFIELFILFFVFTVSIESTVYWFPIIWICSAFVMALLGNWKKEALSRLVFYALIMYWVTALQVAFVTSQYVNPNIFWYDKASYSGSISILMQFGFLIYFYRKCSLADIQFPAVVSIFREMANGIQKYRNSWIFYPLIICTGLFLYFSFDKSILTLLWVVECFMVFVLSIILKEKYFRYVALAALGICIVRLIFFDLAQTSTLARAFVFIGVGIIMLIMNSIYNKYKERFSNDEGK